MKGKDIVDLIIKKGLEDFSFEFVFVDSYDPFPNVRSFSITEVADIGYSEKEVLLGGEEL